MNLKKTFFFLALSFWALQPLGHAEMWWGEVQNIYDNGNSLVMKRINLEKGGLDEVKVNVSLGTGFDGIGRMGDLKIGDTVWVDVEKNAATGAWQAHSVSVPPPAVS